MPQKRLQCSNKMKEASYKRGWVYPKKRITLSQLAPEKFTFTTQIADLVLQ
ncbi:hypothetical protein PGH42_09600 [Legionella pneumophila]|nr:hypothetical protein PGH42_09600 [Legionella pneumophila]